MLSIDIVNVGTVPSYLGSSAISLTYIIDCERQTLAHVYLDPMMRHMNPNAEKPIEAGRRQTYNYHFEYFSEIRGKGEDIFPVEVQIEDEIGNTYVEQIDENLRETLLDYIYNRKRKDG